MVNKGFIAKNDTVTFEALMSAILSDSDVKETA